MASDVSICNLALANLGDTATVASLDPPEGSVQAQLCARFYPIARDMMLESFPWDFATKRIALAELTNDVSTWAYAYATPSDMIQPLDVADVEAISDYANGAQYSSQAYVTEAFSDGTRVIRTNQQNASLRYVAAVTDPTKFTPMFVMTVAAQLSAMLAGPVLKGDVGAAEAKRWAAYARAYLASARESNANNSNEDVQQLVPWVVGR